MKADETAFLSEIAEGDLSVLQGIGPKADKVGKQDTHRWRNDHFSIQTLTLIPYLFVSLISRCWKPWV